MATFGKSPVRSLPINEWPDADRLAWESACVPNRRLVRGGRAAHLKEISKADVVKHYGNFLCFLRSSQHLQMEAPAGSQVTPDAVAAYAEELKNRVASTTTAGHISKLHRATTLISPAMQLDWLKELALDLEFVAVPKSKMDRIVSSDQLVDAGLSMMAEMDLAGPPTLRHARKARDGMMIALLAVCPIRLTNFADLTLGRSLIKVGPDYAIVLAAGETKSGRPDERPVPSFLSSALENYLDCYRPFLMGDRILDLFSTDHEALKSGPLWIARTSGPLSYGGVARGITETLRLFGWSLSPHLFRACAASTVAMHASGNQPNLASALLQHADAKVTEQYYNRASSLHASRVYGDLIRNL